MTSVRVHRALKQLSASNQHQQYYKRPKTNSPFPEGADFNKPNISEVGGGGSTGLFGNN